MGGVGEDWWQWVIRWNRKPVCSQLLSPALLPSGCLCPGGARAASREGPGNLELPGKAALLPGSWRGRGHTQPTQGQDTEPLSCAGQGV